MRAIFRAAIAAAALLAGAVSPAFGQGRIIIVNGNLPGVGFNDPTPAEPIAGNTGRTLGEQRLKVFEFAADVWTAVLNPKVDIYVWARFQPITTFLGGAGALSVSRGFEGAEHPDLWYHEALANHLRGFDPVPHDFDFQPNEADEPNPTDEIEVIFSLNFNFYLGLDNNQESQPLGTQDLLAVAVHELGHGLGFGNMVNERDGTQFLGFGDLYSQYTHDLVTNKHWNEMTDAERVASAINVRKVAWTGVNVRKDVPKVLQPGVPFLRANSPAALGSFFVGPSLFGPPLTAPGVTADLALADDGAADPTTTDACTPLTNPVAGKIVVLDRGGVCTFQQKVKIAQNAGAVAVLIADNTPATPPVEVNGIDPTITIPYVRITQRDGVTLKNALASGATVNLTLGLDMSLVAGTDRSTGLALIAAHNPLQPGSSISHFDGIASPNQVMEPIISFDLTTEVTPPRDLSSSLLTDLGWFSDADGVPDGADACIGSDTRPTVILGQCDSRAVNDTLANGCSVSDRLDECSGLQSQSYRTCIRNHTNALTTEGVLTERENNDIALCARRTSSALQLSSSSP